MHGPVPPVKPSRKERAQATRARIAQAAHELFAERGYQATTMGHIAARAGVAVQTVHFVFHTKPALLREVVDRAVRGDVGDPEQQDWFLHLAEQPDGAAALAVIVGNTTPILARVAPVAWVMRSVPDEEVAAVFARGEQMRRDAYGRMVASLVAGGWLRESLEERRATDLMLFVLSAETYRILVDEYGWAREQWQAWALETLRAQLIAP
jgi:AcrR family transcriptional regulator